MFYTTEFQLGNTDSHVIRTSPAIILVRKSEGHLNTYSIYIYIYMCVCVCVCVGVWVCVFAYVYNRLISRFFQFIIH